MTIAAVSSNGLWLGFPKVDPPVTSPWFFFKRSTHWSNRNHRKKYWGDGTGIWTWTWCWHNFSMFNVTWFCDIGCDMIRDVSVYNILYMYIQDRYLGRAFFFCFFVLRLYRFWFLRVVESCDLRCQAEEFDQLVRCLLDAKEATEPRSQTAMMDVVVWSHTLFILVLLLEGFDPDSNRYTFLKSISFDTFLITSVWSSSMFSKISNR